MSIPENADIENWIVKETPEEVLEPDLPIIDPPPSPVGSAWPRRPGLPAGSVSVRGDQPGHCQQRAQHRSDRVRAVRRILSSRRPGGDALCG